MTQDESSKTLLSCSLSHYAERLRENVAGLKHSHAFSGIV